MINLSASTFGGIVRPICFAVLRRLAQTDALSKLLIQKGATTQQEFLQKIAEERSEVSTDAQSHSIMKIGYFISEGLTLAIVLFAALVVS